MKPEDLKAVKVKRLDSLWVTDGVNRYMLVSDGLQQRMGKLVRLLTLIPPDSQVRVAELKDYIAGKFGNEVDPEDHVIYLHKGDTLFIDAFHDVVGDAKEGQ